MVGVRLYSDIDNPQATEDPQQQAQAVQQPWGQPAGMYYPYPQQAYPGMWQPGMYGYPYQ